MQYTVHEAKTHFARLMAQVREGHEVIITTGRDHTPVMELVAYRRKGGIKLGLYADTELANAPVEELIGSSYTEEELDEMDNNPLFPGEGTV